jgi:ABC-2 type transport system permease protein
VWGKVAACLLPVPLQAGGWLLLLMANGIAIADPGAVLLHVSVGSPGIILLRGLAALHYRGRTNAQFIFSAALVVVLLFLLALPGNAAHLIVPLSVASIGGAHRMVLALAGLSTVLLGLITSRYARRVSAAISSVR